MINHWPKTSPTILLARHVLYSIRDQVRSGLINKTIYAKCCGFTFTRDSRKIVLYLVMTKLFLCVIRF